MGGWGWEGFCFVFPCLLHSRQHHNRHRCRSAVVLPHIIIMAITFFYRFSIDLFFILLTFNYHVLYCFLYSRSSLPFVSSLLPLVFVPSHICVDLPSSRLPPFLSIFLFNSTFACFSLLGFRFSYIYSSLTCFFHVEKQAWQ